ncbi:hypothetical protein [Labilibaculum sp.]|uniref:hypothetical protein n=1 Tax=Labilibaculum sp. TaxID=2060723 RepID=UPI002AA6AEA4|nr:hypothetical protein [Labilibaculum sp.]
MMSRIAFMETYLESDKFLPNLGWCILMALGVLFATYILLNISRFIVLGFEKRITPRVHEITDSKSIVTIDVFNNQVSETKKFEKRYEDEQEAKLNLQNKYDDLEKRHQALLKGEGGEDTSLAELLKSPDGKQEKSKDASLKSMQAIGDDVIRNEEARTSGVDTDKIKTLIQDKDLVQLFNDASLDIIKVRYIQDDDIYDRLLLLDLIELNDRDGDEDVNYRFTKSGEYLRKLILSEDEALRSV